MWIKDPKTDKKSVTLTLFTIAFFVALAKLMLSGLTIYGIAFAAFSGGDFATVIGSIGAIYFGRKFTDRNQEESDEDK